MQRDLLKAEKKFKVQVQGLRTTINMRAYSPHIKKYSLKKVHSGVKLFNQSQKNPNEAPMKHNTQKKRIY
jgi:hypothetical protein